MSVRIWGTSWSVVGGVYFRGGGDGRDPGHGPCGRPAAFDPLGQAEHGQSMVVARSPQGNLSHGAGQGLVSRLEDAPEDLVRGGWVPFCPWGCGSWGEHGVLSFMTHCGGRAMLLWRQLRSNIRARGLYTRLPAGSGRCQ